MSAVEITSTPGGILRVSADTIAALDLLGVTLNADNAGSTTWRVEIHLELGDVITAQPATDPDHESEEDEAA